MLFRKMWRTMLLYKAQFISMIIMTALGVGVFVGFNMEWTSIEKNVSSFFDDTGYADFRIISESGFSEDDVKKISDINGVEKAARFLSVNADVLNKGTDSVTLTVTTDSSVCGFEVIDGAGYDSESADGIWLSDKYATANDVKVGDDMTISYKGVEIKCKVMGLIKSGEYLVCVRDSSQLMPDYDTHGFAYITPKAYREAIGVEYYPTINVISDMDKNDFTDKADDAIGKTVLVMSKEELSSYSLANGEAEEGKTMGAILPTLFLLISVLTMITTMQRIAAKEKTQIGILKALGFKNKKILLHYTSYALFTGLIGSVIGVGLGFTIAGFIMSPNGMMGTYFDMPEWKLYVPWFCYVVLVGIIILLTFIGFMSVKKILRGSAADVLRPYSPKKMKPMLIEKTRLFHKLPFGSRWNLRDTVRHKSRTAMSLIGIVGCMILMVGSLGMSDTMDAFLKMYYDDATNYSSRIYLSEDASDEKKEEIRKKYDGDVSSSVSVKAKEKTVSLDIYGITHDKVRFPGRDNKYVTIENDGAYICTRISDELGLAEGDKIVVSPYGSDDEYELKVNGIIRSVSECIAVSEAYADKLGINYSVSCVYTDTVKDNIAADPAIKSVQSKQMIMDSFDTFTSLMDAMIIVLVGGALLLGVVVLYNLGVMSYTERYREMATLKVVGFKDGKIGKLLISQNLWLSFIGGAIGIPAGIGVLAYLLKALAGEYEMKLSISPSSILISIALTVGMSAAVSLAVARKNKKINMVEALKCAE